MENTVTQQIKDNVAEIRAKATLTLEESRDLYKQIGDLGSRWADLRDMKVEEATSLTRGEKTKLGRKIKAVERELDAAREQRKAAQEEPITEEQALAEIVEILESAKSTKCQDRFMARAKVNIADALSWAAGVVAEHTFNERIDCILSVKDKGLARIVDVFGRMADGAASILVESVFSMSTSMYHNAGELETKEGLAKFYRWAHWDAYRIARIVARVEGFEITAE